MNHGAFLALGSRLIVYAINEQSISVKSIPSGSNILEDVRNSGE